MDERVGARHLQWNVSVRRKAVLIGVNYFGQRGRLYGCITDVRNMAAFLVEHLGYRSQDLIMLTDDQCRPSSQPTKSNILKAMRWLVNDARAGDILFFHYSGHGIQWNNNNHGAEEIIYPVDFSKNSFIPFDEMHRIMFGNLQTGVGLTVILDSYHFRLSVLLDHFFGASPS